MNRHVLDSSTGGKIEAVRTPYYLLQCVGKQALNEGFLSARVSSANDSPGKKIQVLLEENRYENFNRGNKNDASYQSVSDAPACLKLQNGLEITGIQHLNPQQPGNHLFETWELIVKDHNFGETVALRLEVNANLPEQASA
ncbi:MAG: hypothetical protein HC848_09535 [Limnobacter sp.]|nr:hypothetical protein [Limnobacter sp.]